MGFGNPQQIEFIFLPLCGSAFFVLPRPEFSADNIFQTGHWYTDAEHFSFSRILKKILVTRIGCKLNVEFTARPLGID